MWLGVAWLGVEWRDLAWRGLDSRRHVRNITDVIASARHAHVRRAWLDRS